MYLLLNKLYHARIYILYKLVYTRIHIHTYIYIYLSVCLRVCVHVLGVYTKFTVLNVDKIRLIAKRVKKSTISEKIRNSNNNRNIVWESIYSEIKFIKYWTMLYSLSRLLTPLCEKLKQIVKNAETCKNEGEKIWKCESVKIKKKYIFQGLKIW